MTAVSRIGRPVRSDAYRQEFSERLTTALENDPNVPPRNYGQQNWIMEQLDKRFNVKVTKESVSKWLRGDGVPTAEKIRALAGLLHTDAGWLEHGDPSTAGTPREQRARNAMTNGAVNVVAGLIQMDGGTIAFPDEDAPAKDKADIFAIIRGARYSFCIVSGATVGENLVFQVPKTEALVLGLVRDGMNFSVFEISPEIVAEHGKFTRGMFEVTVAEDVLRRVTGFAERI